MTEGEDARVDGPLAAASIRATLWLAVIGAVGLVLIVVALAAGVIMRYVFGAPVFGLNEIVQLLAVVLVMSALPYCTARREHVAVDVFDAMLGRWGRFFGDVTSCLLAGFVLAFLCQRAVSRALDAHEFGDATNMLRMSIWPFYAILAAGAGLCVLVIAMQLVAIVRREFLR